ncbi:TetR/AcrR family transcriptional regulator [Chloroflexota bacterium]
MVRKPSPEKRSLFLSAALKLFVANGVQNTSTAAIAKEAGTASGTLFLYFPTKQDLINQLALEIGIEQSAYIKSILEPTHSARQTFFTIWEGSVRWFLRNIDAYLFNQQIRHSGLVDQATIQESEKFLGYYFDAIQKGLGEGAIKPYPLEVIGGFLYQDIVAVMNLISANPDSDKFEATIQIGFDIFWNGIKTDNTEINL